MNKLKEECGVFGIYGNKDSAALTALGLHSLQHRGQEGCGIVTFDGKNYYSERKLGSAGKALLHTEIKIVDEKGKEVALKLLPQLLYTFCKGNV